MGWNPVGDVKKWYNRVKDEAKKDINKIKGEADRSVKEIEKKGNHAVNEIEAESKKAIKEIENLGDLFWAAIRKELKHAWASGLIDTLIDLAQNSVPEKKIQQLSVFEFEVNLRDKIDVLQAMAHTPPPTSRQSIIEMVEKLSEGDTITILIDFAAFTSALGFTFRIPVKIEDAIKITDSAFKKFGLYKKLEI